MLSRVIVEIRGYSSVVERTLRMCEAPGSNPGISSILQESSTIKRYGSAQARTGDLLRVKQT